MPSVLARGAFLTCTLAISLALSGCAAHGSSPVTSDDDLGHLESLRHYEKIGARLGVAVDKSNDREFHGFLVSGRPFGDGILFDKDSVRLQSRGDLIYAVYFPESRSLQLNGDVVPECAGSTFFISDVHKIYSMGEAYLGSAKGSKIQQCGFVNLDESVWFGGTYGGVPAGSGIAIFLGEKGGLFVMYVRDVKSENLEFCSDILTKSMYVCSPRKPHVVRMLIGQ